MVMPFSVQFYKAKIKDKSFIAILNSLNFCLEIHRKKYRIWHKNSSLNNWGSFVVGESLENDAKLSKNLNVIDTVSHLIRIKTKFV